MDTNSNPEDINSQQEAVKPISLTPEINPEWAEVGQVPTPPTMHEIPQKKKVPIVILVLIPVLIALGAFGVLAYQKYFAVKPVATVTPTPTSTPNPTANWKTYKFSPTVSFKIPTEVADLKYVNSGHYAVQTTLSGGTSLQIWGADGASPSNGKDLYSTLKETITHNSNLETSQTTINGNEATAFTGQNINFQSSIVWGGDDAIKISGLIIKMNDSRALVVIHYQSSNSSQNGDFQSDEIIFNQILSTLEFTNQDAVDTSDWKTYTNEQLGLTFKYPLILENKDKLPGPMTGNVKLIQTFAESNHDYEGEAKIFNGIAIYYVSNISTTDFENYIDTDTEATSKQYSEYKPSKKKVTTFGDVRAYQVDLSPNCSLYYVYRPQIIGVVVISRANLSYSTNPYWTILDNILSTFKFTN